MSDPEFLERAAEAQRRLAVRYRDIADELLAVAHWLEVAPLAEVAGLGRPISYRHSGARAEEEALDAALTAL